MTSIITTHVLDTSRGTPAVNLKVVLEVYTPAKEWKELARSATNTEGRIPDLVPGTAVFAPGIYRLTFLTGAYFQSVGAEAFYPYVPVVFELRDLQSHYHIPLLLNPFGYSTYRGQ
jgi:5-hydroxyisourate hydrolase